MSEQADAIGDLRDAGVLDGLSWSGWSSYRGVMQDYRPAAGHDQGWIGYTGHKLMLNRLDRVFSCEGFAVDESGPVLGSDLVQEGISEIEYRSMPELRPGKVVRDNLNGSPGWRCGRWRWLMSSATFGRVEEMDWRKARPTKRSVAAQPFLDGPDLFTFAKEYDPVVAAWRALHRSNDTQTLMLMHTVDPDTGVFEGFLGRPRLWVEPDEQSWHWIARLDDWNPGRPGRGYDTTLAPDSTQLKPVSDAPVRLRKDSQQQKKKP
ncbi:hypothetical protein GCM10009609_60350 [Pseudonocardia aurantiaca]|uniref:Uncharacterized protein n=1 Tax=Pseudonocardia aurantiaca TaxID=75290 RepID=A0ABW4FG32_9PSEU